MDFMSDQLFDGRRFRLLTIVDDFTRESLAIEVGPRLKGDDVARVLDRIDAAQVRPLIQALAGELRAVVHTRSLFIFIRWGIITVDGGV